MLGADEYAWMRDAQDEWQPDECVVQTATLLSDGADGYDRTWVASGTVACRVMPETIRSGERDLGGAVREPARWVVTLPHDAEVGHGDRVLTAGRALEVVSVAAATSLQTAVRVSCVEVR